MDNDNKILELEGDNGSVDNEDFKNIRQPLPWVIEYDCDGKDYLNIDIIEYKNYNDDNFAGLRKMVDDNIDSKSIMFSFIPESEGDDNESNKAQCAELTKRSDGVIFVDVLYASNALEEMASCGSVLYTNDFDFNSLINRSMTVEFKDDDYYATGSIDSIIKKVEDYYITIA